MVNILLAVDHHIFRQGLQRLIEETGRMRVVLSTGKGRDAVRFCMGENNADVAIVDMQLTDLEGLECAGRIHDNLPKLPIIMLSPYNKPQWAIRSFEAGALGFLTRKANLKEFFSAINKVMNGQRYLPRELQEAIAMAAADGVRLDKRLKSLSRREFQVMVRLAHGETNQEIAQSYNLSVKTVDTYRARLLHKLSIKNNVGLAHYAFRKGLLNTHPQGDTV